MNLTDISRLLYLIALYSDARGCGQISFRTDQMRSNLICLAHLVVVK